MLQLGVLRCEMMSSVSERDGGQNEQRRDESGPRRLDMFDIW